MDTRFVISRSCFPPLRNCVGISGGKRSYSTDFILRHVLSRLGVFSSSRGATAARTSSVLPRRAVGTLLFLTCHMLF